MLYAEDLPVLRGDDARKIDLEVTEKLGRVRVLESVATRIADTIQYHLEIPQSTPLLFVAGKGNNGANSIAAARILHFRGWDVTLVPLVAPTADNLRPNTVEQFALFEEFVGSSKMRPLDWKVVESFAKGVIMDGVLGTGISDPPRGVSLEAITAINASPCRVLSIDVPSGLNHATGEAPGECIRASWTLNLHMLKSGQLEDVAM